MNTDLLFEMLLDLSKQQREEALGEEYEEFLDSLPPVKDEEPSDE